MTPEQIEEELAKVDREALTNQRRFGGYRYSLRRKDGTRGPSDLVWETSGNYPYPRGNTFKLLM